MNFLKLSLGPLVW